MTKKIAFLLAMLMILASFALWGCSSEADGGAEATTTAQDAPLAPQVDPISDNYRTFYQIFVGSFSDSNNDGVGDLRGIINRMDYLNDGNINSGKSLGVQGIWLSPIFSSPSYHKYDVKDYYQIDWRFGTEEDLKELVKLCHERNVKIILDIAINHTSSSHQWYAEFKNARMSGDTQNKYYDYYSCVTTDGKKSGISYQKIAGVDCWVECNFSGDMPELNFDNPEVKTEALNIAKYYLDLGIDGFRFDAIKYIYYGDTMRSAAFWEWYMGELRAIKPDIYCVGECWSGETEILDYYGSMNCFNFAMSQAEGFATTTAKGSSISAFTNYIESFAGKIAQKNPNSMAMSFLSNHDMDRIAGTFVTENYMRMAANLYLLSPGSPVIYYGEELGMRGSRGSENTDANRRLAMLWGDGDFVSDPIGATYPQDKQIQSTVAQQTEDAGSMYNYYCKLIAVRHKYPAIARGDYNSVDCSNRNFGGFVIEYNSEKIGLFHNTSSTDEISVDLSSCSELSGITFSQLADTVGVSGAKLEGTVLTIGPQTSVIIK
jgi:glycosidase